jgi:hypothetical protein
MIHGDNDLHAPLPTSRTIALVATGLGLFCACGIGPPAPYRPPPPDLVTISNNRLHFAAAIGHASEPQQFSIANQSSIAVGLSPQSKWLPASAKNLYSLQTDCKATLPPGSSCTVTITFRPTEVNSHAVNLWLEFRPHEMHNVVLTGRIVAPSTP